MARKKSVTLTVLFITALAVSVGVGTVAAQSSVTEEFNETYGGSNEDSATSAVQTSDGGYALAGFTESFGPGGYDAWLIKTDADGNEEFSEFYAGSGSDFANSVIQTSDGGYAIAGDTNSFGSGKFDAFLIKTDENGNVEFNKTFGGSDNDEVDSVVQTSDGGYALAGFTSSFGPGNGDAWLIKTDSNGNVQINETYGGGSGFEKASLIVQTIDGGYALGAETTSFGSGSRDAWLIKTDADGNEEFTETYGGPGFDSVESVVEIVKVDPVLTSEYALAGATNSFGSGSDDAWLIKTSSNGNEQWNKTYGGSMNDRAESLVRTSDGGFALAGATVETQQFSLSDAWLVKTDESGTEQFNETYGRSDEDRAFSVVEPSDGEYALGGTTKSFGGPDDDAWLIKASSGTDLFTKPLISRFDDPPTNTGNLDGTLYEDLSGDGDGTDVSQTVAVFGQLIRGNDLNGDASDGGLTNEQARALNWNQGSPETDVTPADMVSLFGKQIRAD